MTVPVSADPTSVAPATCRSRSSRPLDQLRALLSHEPVGTATIATQPGDSSPTTPAAEEPSGPSARSASPSPDCPRLSPGTIQPQGNRWKPILGTWFFKVSRNHQTFFK